MSTRPGTLNVAAIPLLSKDTSAPGAVKRRGGLKEGEDGEYLRERIRGRDRVARTDRSAFRNHEDGGGDRGLSTAISYELTAMSGGRGVWTDKFQASRVGGGTPNVGATVSKVSGTFCQD